MKLNITKLLAVIMVLALVLAMPAYAAKITASNSIKISGVLTREEPAEDAVEEEVTTDNLRKIIIVLREGETSLKLHAEASEDSEVLATMAAGDILYVQSIESVWSYAVYGDIAGYVLTDKIALYNEETTPEDQEVIRTVALYSNVDGLEAIYEGTEITLTAELTGFENDLYAIKWQYSADGGATFVDIEGAGGLQYSFVINDENAAYFWKINISILEPVVEEAAEEIVEEAAAEPAAEAAEPVAAE